MPAYIYKGVSKEQREFRLAHYMASIKPQDPRAKKPIFYIDQRDSEELREKKRARVKKWVADRKAEYLKTLDKLDAKVVLTDSRGKQHVFEKGKPVTLNKANSLVAKIEGMLSNPRDPFQQWEKVDEAAKGK